MAEKEAFEISVVRAANAHAIPSYKFRLALEKLCELTGYKLIGPEATEAELRAAWPVFHPWSVPPAPEDRPESWQRCQELATEYRTVMFTAAPDLDKLMEE